MMVGIIFATHREAQPLLARSSAQELTQRPLSLFRLMPEAAESCLLAISGMGKVAAALASAYLIMELRVKLVVSAGLCGRLKVDGSWSVGDLLRITQAVEGDCDRFGRDEAPTPCSTKWFRQLPGARLVTCDRPVFDAGWRDRLSALGDLVDMEGAAVARVAGKLGTACAMVKGISDACDEGGRQDVADNIDRVSARIADVLMDELARHAGS